MRISGPLNSGVAAGGAGVATNNATMADVILGKLYALYVKYNHSPPAGTTDVTIATAGAGSFPALTILTLTNAATDGWFYPRTLVHDNAGSALTGTQGGDRALPVIADKLKVTIAGANDADSVDVYFL